MKKNSLVLIIIIFATALLLFASSQIFNVPYIGKVRKLFDSNSKETKLFVPILEDELTKERIADAQVLRRGKIKKYLNWLKKESDPDVRRHYLFEISNASAEEAKWVINELIPMLEKEPEENVRIEYISCLSSLAANAGLSDSEILKILDVIRIKIEKDSSWSVRVHAANVLSWYGGDEGINVIKEVIDKNINIFPNVLYSIPATLQKIGNDTAKTILIKMKSHYDDNLKTDVVWRLYQLGLINKDEVLNTAETVAKNSEDEKARVRAISLLGTMAKDNPETKPKIIDIIKNVSKNEKNENIKRFSIQVLETLGKK